MTQVLVSICIPTYMGAEVLSQTVDTIVVQHRDGLEVVVCDDCSTDGTLELAQSYATRYPFISVYANPKNLGMDENFTQAVLHGVGRYVWLSGQDDVFAPGAIDKLWDVLIHYPAIDFVYFNYRIVNGDLSRDVGSAPLTLSEDAYFPTPEAYFAVLDHTPTFLAATVMRRKFWDVTPVKDFFGTHYVQVGVWLYNFASKTTYVIADPSYILCRCPEDSWKFKGGQMLFEIFSGSLEVYQRIFNSPVNPLPNIIFQKKKREFLRGLPNLVVFLSERGFRLSPLIAKRLHYLFGNEPLLYWCYVWPIVHLPVWFCTLLRRIYCFLPTRRIAVLMRRCLSMLGSSTRV
jgi:glycosyltransferase involved in cell wall biosynthesis